MILSDGRPKISPTRPCAKGRAGQGREERPAKLGAEDAGDIAAYGHEGRMAHRYLAAETGEDVEAVNADYGDADNDGDGEQRIAEEKRTGEQKHEKYPEKDPLRPSSG